MGTSDQKTPCTSWKFFGDFPGSSLTAELNSNPGDFPGGQPLSLGSLTPSPDSQKLSLKIRIAAMSNYNATAISNPRAATKSQPKSPLNLWGKGEIERVEIAPEIAMLRIAAVSNC